MGAEILSDFNQAYNLQLMLSEVSRSITRMLKSRLSRLLVTLPLLAMPLGMLTVNPAKATDTAAEEAVRILTRARGADQQCRYLSSAERNELSRYTVRAEIAAASQAPRAAARAASAAGLSDGKSATCSKDTEADVRETLVAAREAVAAARADEAKSERVNSKPVKSMTAMAEDNDGDENRKLKGSSLGQYTRVVRAYYLERECRSLSRGEADRFWNGVVKLHKSAVRANGASAVARVMASAERRANGSSCGRSAQVQIRKGYNQVLSR